MKHLFNNVLFIGKVAIHLPRVDSTNRYASELISKSSPIEGTVIYADEQYAGRGQIGSKWLSPPAENITMSLLLRPLFLEARQQFLLSQAVALGLYDFLYFYCGDLVKIKWPNDLYIKDKKVAGILIENTLKSNRLDWSIIGLGLNVNQRKFNDYLKNPTSLSIETLKKFDLTQLISQLCGAIEKWYLQLRAQKWEAIRKTYLSRLYRYNEHHPYYINHTKQRKIGKILDIEPSGHLVLEIEGIVQKFGLKEINFI